MLIGLQGAGKSTFARLHFHSTHEYISRDLLRNNKQPARRQQQLIEEALQAGHALVVDNTNATREGRAELIALGQQYGAQIVGYYFEVQIERSLARNRQRNGKERVPDVAIFATLKRLTRPHYKEGFARLYYVRSNDDFVFDVADWEEEGH